MRMLFALTLALLCGRDVLFAQDSLRPSYGGSVGWDYNVYNADFRALPGVPNCCPLFESGDGGGFNIGIVYDRPVSRSVLVSVRANYLSHDGTLSSREPVRVIARGVGTDGAFEHSVKATAATLGIEPLIGIHLFDRLTVLLGARGGMLLTKGYQQKEEIVDPAGFGTFLDSTGADSHSRIRNASSGDLPAAASLLFHAVGAVNYDLPMNSDASWLLVPEIAWLQGLNSMASSVTWRAGGLRFSVGLKYSPPYYRPVRYDTLFARDTTRRLARIDLPRVSLTGRSSIDRTEELEEERVIHTHVRESYLLEEPEPVQLVCNVTAAGVDPSGSEQPLAQLRIEEFEAVNTLPMLNYIFFENGESNMPGRYVLLDRNAARAFRPEHLFARGTIATYHNILSIIGERMLQHPNAKLTLTGCNADVDVERGDRMLSLRRGETVRDYFVRTWGIDSTRLQIESRDLPAHPSNRATVDGQQENRRVEITSDTPEILDVFVAHDTTRTANPPTVRLRLAATASRGVRDWRVQMSQQGVVLKEFAGNGNPPGYVDWDISRDGENQPRFNEALSIMMETSDQEGRETSSRTTLPTRVVTLREKRDNDTGDVRIERYNLILFDYNSSALGSGNARIVKIVQSRLEPASQITVEGFTDRSGDANANRRLAEGRARSSATAIGRTDAVVRGVGEDRLLFDNDLPEGRFLCRTVQITVRTPVGR